MASRRRVNNLLALGVLGTLVQRPMHPYEIASIMRSRNKDHDLPIKWGSLYTVVANLDKHGLIEATENVRQGGRPERTVYRLTEEGGAELRDWVRELLSTPEVENSRFEAGLSFMGALPPNEVAELLATRLTAVTANLAAERAQYAATAEELPRIFMIEWEYAMALREAEITWLRGLIEEMTSGTLPGVRMWQHYHDTGEVPPEIVELAERGATPD